MGFRRAVLNHRNAAPILLEFMPRDVLIWNYELGVRILAELGVPAENRILVIEGLDTLTLGASLVEAAKSPSRAGQVFANVAADAEPTLAEALAMNTRSAEQLFADSIRTFLLGAVPEIPPDVPAPRALIARYRETRAAPAPRSPHRSRGLNPANRSRNDGARRHRGWPGCQSAGRETKMPRPITVRTRPSERSSSIAFFTVPIATSYCWLSRRAEGSALPGGRSPEWMRSRRIEASCT